MNPINFTENGLTIVIAADDKDYARLVYFGRQENLPTELPPADIHHLLVNVQADYLGRREYAAWGTKQNASAPGAHFVYESHRDLKTSAGRKIEIDLKTDSFAATVHWQFYSNLPVLRAWVELSNTGPEPVGLEQVTSFFFHGLGRAGKKKWHEKSRLHFCANSWCGEIRWQSCDLRDLGLDRAWDMTSNAIKIGNTGTWSTKNHLPLGIYENTETAQSTFWQIENNGSWGWEIGDGQNQLYLVAQGPNESDNHWFHVLRPGEKFLSVPVAVGLVPGGFNEAVAALTRYRRLIMRPHWDNEKLPVIFNDYMNCLSADPTTAKELPYIKTAAEVGTEIFVIDAGWYAQNGESWWTTVGAWQPSPDRFEGGILGILQSIRDHGMLPGLWLELEVMGVDCPLYKTWPAECFFRRHGHPIVSRGRYQLDFRHPVVLAHADEIVDRLVSGYGVAFIKMDYNIDAGLGTEVDSSSFGDGLLRHNRAYLAWLDRVWARHPRLIIENCSSGGLRMDYALLERHSIQSLTDQTEVAALARIAAMGPSAAVPEQLGIWVYPRKADTREEVILNCVNGLAGRFYLSGEIAYLENTDLLLIREAVAFHKSIRDRIRTSIPFWPFGPVTHRNDVAVLALDMSEGLMLSAWNFSTEAKTLFIPLPGRLHEPPEIQAYPRTDSEGIWQLQEGGITVLLPPGPSARAALVSCQR